LQPAYPLKASLYNSYLVDQNNVPFHRGCAANINANLSHEQAATCMANRQQYGINTLWINLLCNYSEACGKDATTFDGIPPFTTIDDLSTSNPDYFQRADDMIRPSNGCPTRSDRNWQLARCASFERSCQSICV
jgi:hypothetical protein